MPRDEDFHVGPTNIDDKYIHEAVLFHVLRVVPESNYRLGAAMFIAEDAKAGGIQEKIPCQSRFKPKPACR